MGSQRVSRGWKILCADLGVDTRALLRRADLPGDLLNRDDTSLTTPEYFRLWDAFEAEAGVLHLPLQAGSSISVEAFEPPLFAALCSENLEIALTRLSRYKLLIAEMVLHLDIGDEGTTVACEWIDKRVSPPAGLTQAEVVFQVQLARLGTRHRVVPVRVTVPTLPDALEPYEEWLGVALSEGPQPSVTFSAADARRPFLTANEAMWRFFEGDLSRRLTDLTETASTAERVKAALLELLPSGATSIGEVSKRLGMSTRTLQRRLAAEGQTYQSVLDGTRQSLARHYLETTTMTGAEISFLLGYEDPNSFSRAFSTWTGTTPEQARASTLT